MKILALGDIHAREKPPENRTDNYLETLFDKLLWVFMLAVKESVDVMVFPGDIFDSFKASDNLKSLMIQLFRMYERAGNHFLYKVGVAGQHDQRYHTLELHNTPLGVMEAAGVIQILNDKPWECSTHTSVHFYGASYGEEVPDIVNKKKFNVLVIHKMISIGDYWHGQVEYSDAGEFLVNNNFDLIISGDNHHSFMSEREKKIDFVEKKKQYLINCGSLMRSSSDQDEHQPLVAIFNTNDRQFGMYKIPIKPFNEVMNLSRIVAEKKKKIDFDTFLSSMGDINSDNLEENVSLDFASNLRKRMKELGVDKETEEIIWESLEKKSSS